MPMCDSFTVVDRNTTTERFIPVGMSSLSDNTTKNKVLEKSL